MDVETITKLLDAGYTKEEISQMESRAADQPGEAAAAGNESAGEIESNAGAKDAGEIAAGVPIEAAIEALTNTVNGLKETVKAMQDVNAKQAVTDKPHKDIIGDTIKGFIDEL